jgi:CheY-like chemotaxis protein
MKEAYSTREVAKLCHVSSNSVWRWCEEKRVAHFYTAGGRRRILRGEVLLLLKRLKLEVPPEILPDRRVRVLVVDDESKIRSLIRRAIARAEPDWIIDEAVDGFDAGVKLSSSNPDVMIMDVLMPGVDGIEVCRRIRRDERYRYLRILAISGLPGPGLSAEAREAGVEAFLAKPLDLKEMVRLLRLWTKATYPPARALG